MITNDKEIRDLKHDIATEVCRLAWEGKMTEDEREKIVYQVSPGPKPEYRCCVYKERAIVRERIRLACGLNADPSNDTQNVVQVIRPAGRMRRRAIAPENGNGSFPFPRRTAEESGQPKDPGQPEKLSDGKLQHVS